MRLRIRRTRTSKPRRPKWKSMIYKVSREVITVGQVENGTGLTDPYLSTNMIMTIASKSMPPLPALDLILSEMINGESSTSSGTKPQTKSTKSPKRTYKSQFVFKNKNPFSSLCLKTFRKRYRHSGQVQGSSPLKYTTK